MPKLATLALGALAVVPAGWSGAWFYGKGEIRSQIDMQIEMLRAQGIAASYGELEVGGFPFAYRGQVTAPRYQAPIVSEAGVGLSDWTAPFITFDASLPDIGTINFALADEQSVRITPPGGAAPVDVAIRSQGFQGRIEQGAGRVRVDSEADKIVVAVTPQSEATHMLSVEKLSATGAAPMEDAGKLSASVNLSGLVADELIWSLIDPTRAFPRGPANLSVQGTADTVRIGDAPPDIQNLKIERLSVDAAGIMLDGDGEAVVKNRAPEGAFNIRLSGVGGFLDSVVKAGLAPEKQVALYRVMMNSFARKGRTDGEQLFTIAFKDGFTYVNGRPTFLPAPTIPR